MKAAREFVSDMAGHVSMPEVYVAIRQLLSKADATIDDFVAVVERDSMLAVRIMRIAGSEYFGFPRRCENLYQAISLIGLMQLHDLILGSLCMRTFSAIPGEVLNLREFWRYGVQCGIAARTVGQHGRIEGHHVFFTLGLLHEIGHAAMFLKNPETSLQALDSSRAQARDIGDAERELFGFDYGQVGAELMQVWHLPAAYRQVAEYHRDPELADEEYRPAVQVVHLAHLLCQGLERDRCRDAVERSISRMPRFRNLPANIGEIVAGEVQAHTESVLCLLWPPGAQDLQLVHGDRRCA